MIEIRRNKTIPEGVSSVRNFFQNLVAFRLPADVSYFEQPQVARWEASKNHWRLDGLSDIQFNDRKLYTVSLHHQYDSVVTSGRIVCY